jgi:transcriptional regulator with XRE-family HTH domain
MGENMDIRMRFGKAARYYRKKLGLSQEELASRSELHRTYVSDVERGTRNISIEAMEKLARALEVPLATIFKRVG